MQIKPVNKIKQPDYPNEYLFINNPELFRRYMPMRWSKNKAVASALLAFLVAGAPKNAIAQTKANTEQAPSVKSDTNKTKSAAAKVAPIFVHGDGEGVSGCVSAAPPVFISENEAKQIIYSVFKNENITIDTINDISFNLPNISDKEHQSADSLNFKNFSIKFVGISGLGRGEINTVSRFSGIDTKKTAEWGREKYIKNGKDNAVFFYDPMSREGKEKSKEELAEQVRDFIVWLKKEGMIK